MPLNLSLTRPRRLSDPLTAALLPPPNETPIDRDRRLYEEAEAKRVSNDIDYQLRKESAALARRNQATVKVLLLGQSESGKSTILKQFQLLSAPLTFRAERIPSRLVIYLNLVRSIQKILRAIVTPDIVDAENDIATDNSDTIRRFKKFVEQLAPLGGLEERLFQQIFGRDDRKAGHLETPTLTDRMHLQPGLSSDTSHKLSFIPVSDIMSQTLSHMSPITSSSNCKKSFSLGGGAILPGWESSQTSKMHGWWEDANDPVHLLNALAGGEYGMMALWQDEEVRKALRRNMIRIEESSGFYLDDIERVTSRKYIPTDEDILKAHIKTDGVTEHSFMLKSPSDEKSIEWRVYDAGGSRSQRQAWVPYFDSVNAIIFLAPISAFDSVLAEDHTVNSLEDSVLLWKALVANKLLANVKFILFLNKCDLLRSKLEAGVQVNRYIRAYGDRPNNYDSVSRFLHTKFRQSYLRNTANKSRKLHIHMTSSINALTLVIANVWTIILDEHIERAGIL